MTISSTVQKMVYSALVADAGVSSLVNGRIYDGPPKDVTFPYISFGPSFYTPVDEECFDGREEVLQLDVWSRDQGRHRFCKDVADAVKSALHDYDVEFETLKLASLRVQGVRVFDDPDGITAHGVVTIEVMVEE